MVVKYDNCYYWENLIVNNASIWENSFENLSLTRDSIFIHTTMINYDKNILEENWAYYPNVKAMLGFVQYVFIPTAFFTWLNNDVNEVVIPLAPTNEILEHMKDFNKEENEHIMYIMKENIDKLSGFWNLEDKECIEALKKFSNEFNNQWCERNGKLLNFNIFEEAIQIGEYIVPKEENIFVEVLEEEMGLTKKQWEDVYMNVYNNEFIRKKFIDILNYKIGYFK